MEKTLCRTLDSLLAQTYPNYEIIVVDDGSNDGSGRIGDEYAAAHENFHTIHKPNGGASSARNKGMEHARGEWITFCDADDYVLPEWLAIFAENCEGNDLVVQGFITDKSDITQGVDYTGNARGCFKLLSEHHILGYTQVKLFRRDRIRQCHLVFNEQFIFHEDEDFLLKYLNAIDRATCVKAGAYVYNMPDFETKYAHADNFSCDCSIFRSIRELWGTRPLDPCGRAYLDRLDNALFHSFEVKKADRVQRVMKYRQAVGKYVMYSHIHVFSKLVLLLIRSPKTVSWIFDLKARRHR